MSLPTTACQASFTSGLRSLGNEHRAHAGSGQRRRRVDAVDAGAGKGAAHEAGVQHAGARDVVDERAVAGEQAGVLDARDPGSRISGCDGLGHGKRSNASSKGRYETSAEPTIDHAKQLPSKPIGYEILPNEHMTFSRAGRAD